MPMPLLNQPKRQRIPLASIYPERMPRRSLEGLLDRHHAECLPDAPIVTGLNKHDKPYCKTNDHQGSIIATSMRRLLLYTFLAADHAHGLSGFFIHSSRTLSCTYCNFLVSNYHRFVILDEAIKRSRYAVAVSPPLRKTLSLDSPDERQQSWQQHKPEQLVT